MIDVVGFAQYHSAFWMDQTPTSEHFVRRLNIEYAERWIAPLEKPTEQIRSAFVAELAFSCACAKLDGLKQTDLVSYVMEESKRRIAPFLDDKTILDKELSPDETDQIMQLEWILLSFFEYKKTDIITRPLFRGCGYIDSSEGDILYGDCLFEVKAVERPFRSVDIRQLITYSALNHASQQYVINNIGLFNPRRGLYFTMPIDEVCHEVSGRSSQDLFERIVHAISSGDISR